MTKATSVHVGFKLFLLLWHTGITKPDLEIFIALQGWCKIQVFFNFYLKFQNFTPCPTYLYPLRIKLKDFGNKIIFLFGRFFLLKLGYRSPGKYSKSNKNFHNFQLIFIKNSSFHMEKVSKSMIICGCFMMKVST